MKLAIFGDPHGDLEAVKAILHLTRKCDAIWCLGDLVDDGPLSEETALCIAALQYPTVRGNHDRWAVNRGCAEANGVRQELSTATLNYLAALPIGYQATLEGIRVGMWHARPRSDFDVLFVDSPVEDLVSASSKTDAQILLVGHSHTAFRVTLPDGRLLISPGAACRERNLCATYGVLELPPRKFTLYDLASESKMPLKERILY